MRPRGESGREATERPETLRGLVEMVVFDF